MKGTAMRRLLFIGITATFGLAGCHASMLPRPPLGQPEATRTGQAMLQVGVQWPRRSTQVIPLSAETLWIHVKKGAQTLHAAQLRRPDPVGTQTATMSFVADADTGLSVRAEAFRAGQASTSVPIAAAQAAGVDLYPNQRTTVVLDLAATTPSSITAFSPTNGGPGVMVSVSGQFSPSGYYRMALGSAESHATYKHAQLLEAVVPVGAQSGPLTIYDDGFPWLSSPSFHVLSVLTLSPSLPQVVAAGQSRAFSVPTALDTAQQQVSDPTITGWMLLNPVTFEPSPVGTLTASGGAATFSASPTATGSAWLYVRSGNLIATVSVTVE